MWEHFTAPQNLPFAFALGLLLILFILQVVGTLVGTELFGFLDSMTPDFDLDLDLDVDAGAMAHGGGFIDHLFALLNLGRIPVVFSIVLWLFLFSFIGYTTQFLLLQRGLPYLTPWIVAPAAFAVSLPFLRLGNAALYRVLPKDETEVVSEKTFIGRVATITVGTVTHLRQSEARLTDPRGRTQYIQVISDNEGDVFEAGSSVLVVSQRGPLFTVISPPNPQLTPSAHPLV